MTGIPAFWWRVEVDKAGAILSCVQFDEERVGTKRVVYVQSKTRKEAIRLAAHEWHVRHKQHQSKSQKRLALKRKAAGHCIKCTEPVCEDSKILCRAHVDYRREWRLKQARGETKTRVPADPVKLKEQHLADHRLRARLGEQLPELLAKYDELDGAASPFRIWLERELDAREGATLRLVRTG